MIFAAPKLFMHIIAIKPIGPTPSTATVLFGISLATCLVARSDIDKGSTRAASSNETLSGKGIIFPAGATTYSDIAPL